MKKVLSTVVIIMMSVLYIYSQGSKATFFTQNGEKFWIVINGEKKNKDPLTKVTIDGLTAQNYKIKVVFQDANIPSLDKVIYTKNVETNAYTDATYVIRKNSSDKKYVIRILSGEELTTTTTTTTSTTPENSNVTTTTTTTSSNQPTQTVQQTTTVTDPNTNANINMGVGINVNETPNGVDMNVNMGGMNVNTNVNGNANGMNTSTNMNAGGMNTSSSVTTSSTTTTTTTTTTTNNGKPVQQSQVTMKPQPKPQPQIQPQPVKPAGGCASPMNTADFQAAKQSISSKSFEDSKLTIAKQIVGANCLMTDQVKEIMLLFSFESTRLDFAKYAYKYTYDKNNYYKLNDGFKFESSIDELNEFINGAQ